MSEKDKRRLSLRLPAHPEYVGLVMQFVERTAGVFGLAEGDVKSLELATEEIFMYLATSACPGGELLVECSDGVYFTEATFRFPAGPMNLRGLNIAPAAPPNLEEDVDLSEMGLLIASRSVDRLNLTVEQNDRFKLTVVKEKSYPRIEEPPPRPEEGGEIAVITPDAERIKDFAVLAAAHYREAERPACLDFPGKVVDMVAGGDYHCLIAVTPRSAVVGGLLFHYRTEKIVACHGPYLFPRNREGAAGEALLEACIGRVARGKALGIITLSVLPPGLQNDSETIGQLTYYGEDTTAVTIPHRYRHLHEDAGGEVWIHRDLRAYLEETYARLYLARNIRHVRDVRETRPGFSLFAADVARGRGEVMLRPLLPGGDFEDNLKRTIMFLRQENFRNIFFTLDLGIPWHAELIPLITVRGFRPGIVLPGAGRSDMIVFQYHAAP